MKRSMFVLAIVVVTAAIGCQESNMVGPFEPTSVQANPAPKAALPDNIIILEGAVQGPFAQYWIDGRVKYSLTQLPILSQDLFDLVLDTDATISQPNNGEASWRVSNSSSERVNLTGQTSATVDRWYFLRGGPSSLDLHLQFAVAASGVTLTLIAIE